MSGTASLRHKRRVSPYETVLLGQVSPLNKGKQQTKPRAVDADGQPIPKSYTPQPRRVHPSTSSQGSPHDRLYSVRASTPKFLKRHNNREAVVLPQQLQQSSPAPPVADPDVNNNSAAPEGRAVEEKQSPQRAVDNKTTPQIRRDLSPLRPGNLSAAAISSIADDSDYYAHTPSPLKSGPASPGALSDNSSMRRIGTNTALLNKIKSGNFDYRRYMQPISVHNAHFQQLAEHRTELLEKLKLVVQRCNAGAYVVHRSNRSAAKVIKSMRHQQAQQMDLPESGRPESITSSSGPPATPEGDGRTVHQIDVPATVPTQAEKRPITVASSKKQMMLRPLSITAEVAKRPPPTPQDDVPRLKADRYVKLPIVKSRIVTDASLTSPDERKRAILDESPYATFTGFISKHTTPTSAFHTLPPTDRSGDRAINAIRPKQQVIGEDDAETDYKGGKFDAERGTDWSSVEAILDEYGMKPPKIGPGSPPSSPQKQHQRGAGSPIKRLKSASPSPVKAKTPLGRRGSDQSIVVQNQEDRALVAPDEQRVVLSILEEDVTAIITSLRLVTAELVRLYLISVDEECRGQAGDPYWRLLREVWTTDVHQVIAPCPPVMASVGFTVLGNLFLHPNYRPPRRTSDPNRLAAPGSPSAIGAIDLPGVESPMAATVTVEDSAFAEAMADMHGDLNTAATTEAASPASRSTVAIPLALQGSKSLAALNTALSFGSMLPPPSRSGSMRPANGSNHHQMVSTKYSRRVSTMLSALQLDAEFAREMVPAGKPERSGSRSMARSGSRASSPWRQSPKAGL